MKTDHITLGLLCDHYGALLTEHQRRCLQLHCDRDYSLSEIAEQEGVTRQGVHAALRRAGEALERYERELGCLARARRTQEALEAVRAAVEKLLSRDPGPAAQDAASEILHAIAPLEE